MQRSLRELRRKTVIWRDALVPQTIAIWIWMAVLAERPPALYHGSTRMKSVITQKKFHQIHIAALSPITARICFRLMQVHAMRILRRQIPQPPHRT
mmetsp:Transcript_9200/g.25726  ORF Transcript_9200/g.25726 Transcript_9200/m.25726 type:complete len:96 (+) Transcript_9200:716-1003(+)